MNYWFDPEYFRLYSIHTEGVDERQYQQHLEQAQEFLLVELIGESLKNHLYNAISGGTATTEEQNIVSYIKKYLLYNVELKLCDFLSYRNTSKGVQEFTQSDSSVSDYSNNVKLKDTFKQYIEQWKVKICKYLHDNRDSFPLWDLQECGECYNKQNEQIDVYF